MKVSGLTTNLTMWLDPCEAFRLTQGDDPLEWQETFLWETRNAVVLKGRQVGASTSAGVLCTRFAKMNPDSLACIVSPSLKQSTEVKTRARRGLTMLGEKLLIDSSTTVGLMNGSRIVSLPGSKKSVRGWTADLLVIDEAAFLDPDTFLAARATVATGGRIIVQSTPAGPYGHFFDLFNEATDAEEAKFDPDVQWVRFKVSSEDVPTISKEFLASEKATMTDEAYAQEYLGQFASAGMGLVDPDKLRALTESVAPTDIWGRLTA